MRTREKREKRREVLTADRRLNEHKSGGGFAPIKVPPGVPMFNPRKEGSYKLDIIPFRAGEGNPFAEPGQLYFERTYYTHQRCVGPNGDTVICPAQTFKGKGKACYVCEVRGEMGKDPEVDKDDIKKLNSKERQIWLVYDHAEPKKGIQVWEISYHLFGINLEKKINARKELRDQRKRFADPKEGYTLVITATEKEIGSNKTMEFTVDEFLKRKPLKEELVDHGLCPDEWVVPMSYGMVKKLFNAAPEDEEEEEEDKPKKGKKRPRDEHEDEEDENGDSDEDTEEEEDDEDLAEPPAQKGETVTFEYKGKTLTGRITKVNFADNLFHIRTKKRPDQPYIVAWDDIETSEDEDEEEEDEPKPKKKTKKPKDEDEDEDEPFDDEEPDEEYPDDEDDEPAPRKKKLKKRRSSF